MTKIASVIAAAAVLLFVVVSASGQESATEVPCTEYATDLWSNADVTGQAWQEGDIWVRSVYVSDGTSMVQLVIASPGDELLWAHLRDLVCRFTDLALPEAIEEGGDRAPRHEEPISGSGPEPSGDNAAGIWWSRSGFILIPPLPPIAEECERFCLEQEQPEPESAAPVPAS